MSITNRMAIFYIIILVFSIALCTLLYQQIYYRITSDKISEVSMQNLYSIRTSVEQTIDNLNNYSKMTLANDDLQYTLRSGNIYTDLVTQKRVHEYLVHLIEAVPQIESVYFFDSHSNEYMVGNLGINQFNLSDIKDAGWYNEVLEHQGSYILKLNGGGAFTRDTNSNFVSMIRVVRDLNSIKPIGILILNIRESAFKLSYNNILDKYKTDVTLLDENDESIVKSGEASVRDMEHYLSLSGMKEYDSRIEKRNGAQYLYSHLHDSNNNWKLVSVMPIEELLSESRSVSWVGLLIILVNGILLFIGSIFISRILTNPIKKLLRSMRSIERGEFKQVDIKAGHNEIGRLRDGYNMMIHEIQKLIGRVIEEHNFKRKAELNLLQAQIRPHFLYNTLDSINSLAISGRTEAVSEIVEALGQYYRISLSKGKEVITIGEEIEGVRNYLKIQKIRYGDMFDVSFDIDERVLDRKILKLILQPLVENALYHGIRAQGEPGTIQISAKYAPDFILLTVEDDGAGMSEESLRKLLDDELNANAASFGVKGTLERLRIFYGVDQICTFESRVGSGTKVTIKIPNAERNEDAI
ncbi:sensor histidine kinase [Cohnella yongneupensis]|uniref:histidine kinase n=1 Tax=Cohnella yongneupensis TaxID=425006 RepID=A0ABW0R4N5_9BACL